MSRNVVVIQDSGEISSFSNQTLTLDWENTDYLRRKPSNAVDYQGNIIFGDVEGFVHVIDGSNGNTIGRMKISSNPIKNLVKRGNEIYILDSELKLFVINRDV